MKEEIRAEILVSNEEGLHARPAALVVQALRNLNCEVFFSVQEGEEVNAKSILGVMMLAAEQGTKIRVRASGRDASQAMEEITRILAS
jgi:phosphocarrier protein